MELNGYQISNRKAEFISLLYQYRGLKVDQIYQWLYPSHIPYVNRKKNFLKNDSKRHNIYKYLTKLEKMGLVSKRSLVPNENKNYYFLTKQGVEVAYSLLDIPFGYKSSSGYGDDIGEFEYDMCEPPHERMPHHLMMIDFFILLNEINHLYDMDILFRDNRYASEDFDMLEESGHRRYRFRPDAQMKLDSSVYNVEIDRGTERYMELKKKFGNYARYCRYLDNTNQPLPKGILFITPEKKSNPMTHKCQGVHLS